MGKVNVCLKRSYITVTSLIAVSLFLSLEHNSGKTITVRDHGGDRGLWASPRFLLQTIRMLW